MNIIIKSIPFVIASISLVYCIYRWAKLMYYCIKGHKTIGTEEKSKFLVKKSGTFYYYWIYYLYYDEQGNLQKGKMSKLYRQGDFEAGKEITVRYLPNHPDESICITVKEFFSYELFALLFALIILFGFFVCYKNSKLPTFHTLFPLSK